MMMMGFEGSKSRGMDDQERYAMQIRYVLCGSFVVDSSSFARRNQRGGNLQKGKKERKSRAEDVETGIFVKGGNERTSLISWIATAGLDYNHGPIDYHHHHLTSITDLSEAVTPSLH
jgi:hypothetical protein